MHGTYAWSELRGANASVYNTNSGEPIVPVSNRANVYALMANSYYDFQVRCRWPVVPFIGAGIGIARLNCDSTTAEGTLTTTPPSQVIQATITQISPTLYGYALGWQFKAGLGYQWCDDMNVNLQYRLLGTTHFEASDSVMNTNPTNSNSAYFFVRGGDIRGMWVNAIELNFRYTFNV